MKDTIARPLKGNRASIGNRASMLPRGGAHTKDALLRVALEHYQRHGYEATSLRAITQELGLTVAATYYHFKSKEELLVAAYRRNLEYLQVAHDNIAATLSSPERLWTFVQLHTCLQRSDEGTGRQPYSAALLLDSIPEEYAATLRVIMCRIRDRLRGIITAGIRAKSFDKVNTTAAAYAIFGMSHSVDLWFRPGGALTMEQVATMYADFALRIVGARPVRNRADMQRLTRSALAAAGALK